MPQTYDQMMEVLEFNRGFTYPEKWIAYGVAHDFRKTRSEKLEECPDCRARHFKTIGQFIHYSNLAKLQKCAECGLIYTDTRIDPEVISAHFEQAYKDEEYFLRQRRRIFEQISAMADRAAPQGGRVLDVGGAKGHLLATLKARRPDLNFVLNDLSSDACRHAESKYGFETLLCGLNEIENIPGQFDVIIMSDVIYYEPEVRRLWSVLPGLLTENGTVIIRVPNKLGLIRFWQLLTRLVSRPVHHAMQDNIRFFNPEHLFVFSRRYLTRRLSSIGFRQVSTAPSEWLCQDGGDLKHSVYFYLCKLLYSMSFGSLIITPGQLVVARMHAEESGK